MVDGIKTASDSVRTSGFHYLGVEIRRRTLQPVKHVTFWVFLTVGIIVFGGLGFWVEVLRYWRSDADSDSGAMLTSLVAFFPALMGSSALQLVFGEAGKKPLRAVALFVGIVAAIAALMMPADAGSTSSMSFFIASCFSLLAIYTWWLANADDPTFQDALDAAAPVGGSLDRPLSGEISDFKT